MEKQIVEEILKKCNWYERIVVMVFKKIFVKAYKLGITFGFNHK